MISIRRPAFPPEPLLRRCAPLHSTTCLDRLTEPARPSVVAQAAKPTPQPEPAASNPAVVATGAGEATPRRRPLVLVVDDEADLVELIGMNLERNGHDVISAVNGHDALKLARERRPDLILLDLMMPGLDGIEVAKRLRADDATRGLPIVMLTAKADEGDVLAGLGVGADDYVTKPFSTKVLMARVKAVLRRSESGGSGESLTPAAANVLRAGPLAMDLDKHETFADGRPVKLTLTEFKLLRALVEAKGRVLSRDRLMDKGMGTDVFVSDRAIDVHVTAIRKKLGEASWLVHTVRGVGYRLIDEKPEAGDEK